MDNIWNVIFTNLVAETASNRAELQRVVNIKGISVGALSAQVSEALEALVISEAKLAKWHFKISNEFCVSTHINK